MEFNVLDSRDPWEARVRTEDDTRAFIAACVDAQCCAGCGREMPDGVADDDRWFLDMVQTTDGLYAIVRCPECW